MLGIVTQFDFLRASAHTTGQMVPHYDDLMQRSAGEMMTEAVVHVELTALLTRVLQLMVSLRSVAHLRIFKHFLNHRND